MVRLLMSSVIIVKYHIEQTNVYMSNIILFMKKNNFINTLL